MNSEIKYRSDIDGLRAVAVLLVVFFHAFPAKVSGGFVGVDIFFVISGYLISTIIFIQLEEERFSFKSFYIKRVNRIFPALILVMVCSYIFGWFSLFSDEFKELGKHIAAGTGFFSNIVLWDEYGYFDVSSNLKPFLHLWSLSIEEQFYIFWPVGLYLIYKLKMALEKVIILLLVFSFILNLYVVDYDVISAFYLLPTRFWEILIGSYLAYIAVYKKHSVSLMSFNNTKAVVGTGFIAIAVAFFNQKQLYPGYYALLPTLGTALLISAGSSSWINRKILSRPFMVWMGLISYPLYLWHWPLFSFFSIIRSGEKISASISIILIFISVLLASLTHIFIEKKMSKKTAVLITILSCIGLVGFMTYHFPLGRDNSIITEIEKNREQIKMIIYKDSCVADLEANSLEYCMLSQKNKMPTVALVGDSHANDLFFSLSSMYKDMGQNLLLMGKGTCVPFFNVESGTTGTPERCREDMNTALEYAVRSKSIHTIVLASRGPLYITGTGYYERRPDNFLKSFHNKSGSYADIFQDSMQMTLSLLEKSGKKILFIEDNPELSFNPVLCLKPRPFSSFIEPKQPCHENNNEEFYKREKIYKTIVDSVMKSMTAIKVFKTSKYFCDDKKCFPIIDGKLMYRDNNHLSKNGAIFVAEKINEEFYKL